MCAGGGGGFVDISCRKFYFCPFQIKIPHIDEEKELYALAIQGSV